MADKYKVYFENTVYEYQEGDHVCIDIQMYRRMPGASFSFQLDPSDVECKIESDTLTFDMPAHDVNVIVTKQAAGLPQTHIQMPIHMKAVKPHQEGTWKCTSCGEEGNTGKYCMSCGEERP